MDPEKPIEVPVLTEAEEKARKRRNMWLASALVGFVLLILITTVIRLSQSAVMPDGGF